MANLTFQEKIRIEKLLRMGTGYVLDFSNRTFQDFIGSTLGVDIYDEKYSYEGGSKANRLRAFWNVESNYLAGILIKSLLDYWIDQVQIRNFDYDEQDEILYKECLKIVERLKQDGPVENIDSLKANVDDKDFNLLAKSIRESIEKNEPEGALDRLHTFLVRYIRELCNKHSISYNKKTPLHSLFGGYVKHLAKSRLIDSEMTERILKSSISVIEAFNDVRNNQSFAHDNPILNYNESILIFNDVANVVRFIESIEHIEEEEEKMPDNEGWDDLPF
jgi:hypothetical protein